VEKVLKVGDKITDDYTRDEYNRLARQSGMIDIND